MPPYAIERFSDEEAEVLRRFVTNVEGPCFALVNLPEVVKGALFARYSRSAKGLRRLFLDEFAADLDPGWTGRDADATVGVARAEALYDRVFVEYGDDSVAQLGGVHLACEQVSNLLTKVLERGRLMAYLEQSTRYVAYDGRLPNGHYRYYRDPAVLASPLGARYVAEMDQLFETYGSLLPELQAHVARRHPRPKGAGELAWRKAVRAKALDALRGLLPVGSLSNVGVYGSGQAYEQLLLRMRASPLPEARAYAELMVTELRKVIPSFLARLDREDRGGAWVEYLRSVRAGMSELVEELGLSSPQGPAPASVELVDFDPEGEDKVLAAMLYPYTSLPDAALVDVVRGLDEAQREALVRAYVGERRNRRHRPGRAFERTSYRFDVVSDYGAFRDLQRHRMLTVEWQRLDPRLGYEVPELVAEAGLGEAYARALDRSGELYEALVPMFPEQAPYALGLGYRIRYVLELSAREAMHVIELRSGPEGHPSYRAIALAMHRLIAERAGHRALAGAMRFVGGDDAPLPRLDAAERAARRSGPAGGAVSRNDAGATTPESPAATVFGTDGHLQGP